MLSCVISGVSYTCYQGEGVWTSTFVDVSALLSSAHAYTHDRMSLFYNVRLKPYLVVLKGIPPDALLGQRDRFRDLFTR